MPTNFFPFFLTVFSKKKKKHVLHYDKHKKGREKSTRKGCGIVNSFSHKLPLCLKQLDF